MPSTRDVLRPPIWVRAADIVTVSLLLLAATVWVTGGFVLHAASVRLSLTSEWRILVWALGFLLVRHAWFRRPAIHQRVASGLREAVRMEPGRPLDELLAEPAAASVPPSRATLVVRAVAVILLFWGLTFAMTYPADPGARSRCHARDR